MAKVYYRKIVSGDMELSQVPARWREAVEALIEERGVYME